MGCVYYQSDFVIETPWHKFTFLNVLFVHIICVPVKQMQTKHLCAFMFLFNVWCF